MPKANFCAECGERLSQKGWRARFRSRLCANCARRMGSFATFRGLAGLLLTAAAAYGFGRYLRPAPPPLIIQRLASSPLPDGPIDFNPANAAGPKPASASPSETAADDQVYICGARTKKGAPCRRRVHVAGERCFQHKGMAAMVALDKLVIKPDARPK
jgi:hypothetical protein